MSILQRRNLGEKKISRVIESQTHLGKSIEVKWSDCQSSAIVTQSCHPNECQERAPEIVQDRYTFGTPVVNHKIRTNNI